MDSMTETCCTCWWDK